MEINIKKEVLLEKLQTNKERHVTDYNEALEIYNLEIEKALVSILNDFKLTKELNLNLIYKERKPDSHEEDYIRAIKMLNFCVDDTLVLSEEEYDQFIEDNWNWKANWNTTISNYKAMK